MLTRFSWSDVPYPAPILDPGFDDFFTVNAQQPQRPMAVTSLIDNGHPGSVVSEEKSQSIVDMIVERFNEPGHSPMAKGKDDFLEGDRSDDRHVLSRRMMQVYIDGYWLYFSEQLPIRKSLVPNVSRLS